MSAFSKLVVEGKKACEALARATPWSKEEWARSIRTLERAGLFPEIGLEQVVGIVQKTGVPPDDVAQTLVREAKAYVAEQIEQVHRRGEVAQGIIDLPPSPDELKSRGRDLSEFLVGKGAKVSLLPSTHEKTTVCHARSRDYPAAPHLHDCRRLAHDADDRSHECACGGIW